MIGFPSSIVSKCLQRFSGCGACRKTLVFYRDCRARKQGQNIRAIATALERSLNTVLRLLKELKAPK